MPGLKKDKCLSVEKILVLKFWQSHFKEIIELITSKTRNSLIKSLFYFHAVFSNSDRRIYVVEEKLQQPKVKREKILLLNITTLVKLILFSSTCSV